MKIITEYGQFLNENVDKDIEMEYFLSELIKLNKSSKDILRFRDALKENINESVLNEGLFDKLSNWLNDKLIKFLIERKKNFYVKLIDKLSIFDLTTLDDTFENYPTFTKLKSLYLAGGMDEAEGGGAGWRLKLEGEFGKEHVAGLMGVKDLDEILENPKKLSKFKHPVLLNPVRKEVDRTKDDEFKNMIDKLKQKDYDPKQGEAPFRYIRNTFTRTIEPDDEHLLRISDAVFLGMDRSAGAGTYGELQLLSISRKPLFCWLINKSEGLIGEVKLWNIPHLSKVMLNEDDMKVFVKTLKNYA
jgi:hypothetical protein